MTELLRKLLASTAMYAPHTDGGTDGPNDLDDEIVGDDDELPPEEGAEDDEDEDAAAVVTEDAAHEDEEPAPRQSRGEKRFQTLANELKAEREARARNERLLEELRQERQRSRATVDAEQEAQQLALMTVEERVEYKLNKALAENQRQTQLMQFQAADASDKGTFEGKYRGHPKYGKYCDEVEAELLKSRQAGVNVARDVVLAAIIGRRVLNGTPSPTARKEAQGRVKRNTTRPADTRGGEDRGRRGGKSLEERLENLTF